MAGERADYGQTLALLARKGVTYSTVIDLGCADGHFFVRYYLQGLFTGCVPVNIDASALYRPSLEAIQDALGGHFRIAAAAEQKGEITITTAAHPYWASVRQQDDLYWERLNKLSTGQETVPAIRVDDLAEELQLKPPYLLKLDVQGAEVAALRGARRILDDTHVVICEADIADFQAINAELVAAGFILLDITALSYTADNWLGWFYPVYLNARLAHLIEPGFWRQENSQAVVEGLAKRRNHILELLAAELPKIKARKNKP